MIFSSNNTDLLQQGIYGLIDTATDKIVYVGQTKTSFISRFGQHINDSLNGKHSNTGVTEVVKSNNFQFTILEITKDMANIDLLETLYINAFDTHKNGFNKMINDTYTDVNLEDNTFTLVAREKPSRRWRGDMSRIASSKVKNNDEYFIARSCFVLDKYCGPVLNHAEELELLRILDCGKQLKAVCEKFGYKLTRGSQRSLSKKWCTREKITISLPEKEIV